MKKVLAFVLFALFSLGLIGCAAEQSAPESKQADTTANSNSSMNTGATPPGETQGKSDADK